MGLRVISFGLVKFRDMMKKLTTQEAVDKINDLVFALNKLKEDAVGFEIKSKLILKLEDKIWALNEEKSNLLQYKKWYKNLEEKGSLAICKDCNGDGGHACGDEFSGWDFIECETCSGEGVIPKTTSD
jgi:DnaJ-class molecular chaperone